MRLALRRAIILIGIAGAGVAWSVVFCGRRASSPSLPRPSVEQGVVVGRHGVILPAEVIPEELRKGYEDEEGHIHLSSDVEDLDSEVLYMKEYKGWGLPEITREFNELDKVLSERLDAFFDEKEARGEGVRKPPSGFDLAEDGTEIPIATVSSSEVGENRHFRSVGQPDGSTILYTVGKDEDPVLQELIDRVYWLEWRRKMLVAEERLKR